MNKQQAEKKFPSYFENFQIPEWAKEQELTVYRACATGKVDHESFLNSFEENGFKISGGGRSDDPQEYSLSTYIKFRDVKRYMTLDTILFESKYPVMFTCKNNADIFLFICCLVNASTVKWIGTKTDYDTLISLLENKITIRDAFLGVTEEKLMIEYNGQDVICNVVTSSDIENNLLPTVGEFMDAESGEYAEEIADFKARNKYIECKIYPQINSLIFLNYSEKSIILTDDFFNQDSGITNEMRFAIGKIQRRNSE